MATSDISAGVDDTTVLDDDDLNEVIEFVQDIKANYFTLGTALRLKLATVEGIKKERLDIEESLLKVINEWLLKNYNYEKFGKPTWKALVKAVASPMGGKNVNLALKIAEKHPAAGGAGSNGISMHEPTMQAEIPSAAAISSGQTLSPTTGGSAGATPQQPAGPTVVKSTDVYFLASHLCQNVSHKWSEVGFALGFLDGELKGIGVSYPRATVQQLLTEVLSQWCQWPTVAHPHTPTMERLCDALRSSLVELGAVASDLYELRHELPSKQQL